MKEENKFLYVSIFYGTSIAKIKEILLGQNYNSAAFEYRALQIIRELE